jgi:hypothetical protein
LPDCPFLNPGLFGSPLTNGLPRGLPMRYQKVATNVDWHASDLAASQAVSYLRMTQSMQVQEKMPGRWKLAG